MEKNEQLTKKAIAVSGTLACKMARIIVSQHDLENVGRMHYNSNGGVTYQNVNEKTRLAITSYQHHVGYEKAIELIRKKAPNAKILFLYGFPIDAPDEYGDIIDFIYSEHILGREVYWW